jgi:HD-GYP domain-containing protein (c-di-GMP phosphodiesterase class II)
VTILKQLEALSRREVVFAVKDGEAQPVDRLARRLRALDLLNRVARELTSELDPERLIERILQIAHESMGFSHCAVLLIGEDGSDLKVQAAVGYRHDLANGHERPRRVLLSEGVTGRVARTGRAELVTDVEHDESYIEGVTGGRCEMAAPLRCRGKLLGVLDAEATEAGAFDEIDFETFVAFADHAAIALNNAKAYREARDLNATLERATSALSDANERLEQQVNELALLNEAGRVITSTLSLRETLTAIGNMVIKVTQVRGGSIDLPGDADGARGMSVEFGVRAETALDALVEICVPLMVGNRTVGQFRVWRESVRVFVRSEQQTFATFANQAAIAIENARLFEHTQAMYVEVIRSLAEALEARDAYTKGHSERVMTYSLVIAESFGLDADELEVIRQAALLHDIGKIGIRDNVLLKPMKLTPDEWKLIEGHPAHADRILAPIRFLDRARLVVRAHHERFDGKGFPEGIAGEAIPLGARIVAVADAFDAMTTDRPYRKGMPFDVAVVELRRHAGTQFDPGVIEKFGRALETKTAESVAAMTAAAKKRIDGNTP